jgi:hypothetical protein
MDPLAIDLLLLRDLKSPAIRLAPGRALMARVVQADGSGHGVLSIAGAMIEAKLPKGVRPGDQLRLVVRRVSAGKVELEAPSAHTTTAAHPLVPLPGGGTITPVDDEQQGGGGEARDPGSHTLALRYEAPRLGPVDLRFELASASLHVSIALSAGEPLSAARQAADALRGALEQAMNVPVALTISPRRDPLDVYA